MTNSSSQFCPGSNLAQEIKSFPCFIVKGGEKWSKAYWGIDSFFNGKRNKRKISLFQRNLAWNNQKIYELPRSFKPSSERKTDIRDVVEVICWQRDDLVQRIELTGGTAPLGEACHYGRPSIASLLIGECSREKVLMGICVRMPSFKSFFTPD